jgi:hypothetical protein
MSQQKSNYKDGKPRQLIVADTREQMIKAKAADDRRDLRIAEKVEPLGFQSRKKVRFA